MNKIKVVDLIMGGGKAQPLDSLVLSENGFIKMRDIAIGAKVFGEDGELHNVIGIYPQGSKRIYNITFSDDSSVECCEDHLWTYQKPQDKAKEYFRTEPLKKIINQPLYKVTNRGDKNWQYFIPLTKPINFLEKDLPIDPYVLGVLIGDGDLGADGISITNSEIDIINKISLLLKNDFELSKKGNSYSYHISDSCLRKSDDKYMHKMKNILSKLNLLDKQSPNKFIPIDYLYNSIPNRIKIMQGLIDTDGEVINNKIIYSTTSHQLALDIQFLVQSLGGTAKIENRQTHYTYKNEVKEGSPSYRIFIKMSNDIEIFSSKKHTNKYKKGNSSPKRTIQSIEYIGLKECQCIVVDNPSKLYLTDNFIVTHNSTYCHKTMKENKDQKYIYITPYLDEIKRLIGDKDNRTEFYTERKFREPLHLGDGKLDSLHDLLIKDYNIVTTHALFRMTTPETLGLIEAGDYILMLDEALNVVDVFDIVVKDYDMLLNSKLIEVDDKGNVTWLDDEYEGKFTFFKTLCKNGTVAQIKKTQKVQFLAWNFNSESFKVFKEVNIFTYLFEASLMSCYFAMNNIEYDKYTIENNNITLYKDKKPYDKKLLKQLINIYEGNLNTLGNKETALSMNWFKNYPDLRSKLKNNIYNYFRRIIDAKGNTIIWTTFKSNKKHLSGSGYTRRFIPCNTRATNEYKSCFNLAYCCNRYISPDYIDYFYKNGVTVDEDLFALSELLQWVWRSAIREGRPINIYIPSSRMRNIMIDWLNNENI
jgi:hypothetical protein